MKYDAVIFDLGNTLVSYYTRPQWPEVLSQAIDGVAAHLGRRGRMRVNSDELTKRVEAEGGERDDHRVRPLEGRLARIFKLSEADLADGAAMEMCHCFMKPIFALARRYGDALPTLEELRRRGVKTAILSNTPWGSPAELWREELGRLGLRQAVDAAAFCRDVGYRKPAPQSFEFVMRALHVSAEACLFVGDDPRWDIAGPRGVGMEAVLICRAPEEKMVTAPEEAVSRAGRTIASLGEVIRLLD